MKKGYKKSINWLNEAKKQGYEWADAAIDNCKNDDAYTGDCYNPCLSMALTGAFLWENTKQGTAYWKCIVDELTSKGL